MAAPEIIRTNDDDDVFEADETKVHTLSRQVIADMLDSAARRETNSSAPPPSGVRRLDTATDSPVPVMWDDDADDLEPTRVSKRAQSVRPSLVTLLMNEAPVAKLMNEPPIIICDPREVVEERGSTLPQVDPATPHEEATAPERTYGITIAAFLATIVPALVLLYYFGFLGVVR